MEVGSILINSFNDKPGQKELIRSRNEERKRARAVAEIAELKKLYAVHPPTPAPSINAKNEDSDEKKKQMTKQTHVNHTLLN